MAGKAMSNWIEEARATLEEQLRAVCGHPSVERSLQDILTYAVFPAGKRIRPLLAISMGLDLGASLRELLAPAAAIELLHCASLIHDDLPALDNDDMRRGKPSSHRVFGEGHALLAGDTAVPLALHSMLWADLQPEVILLLVQELTGAFVQVCNGQQLDLLIGEARGEILSLYAKKTGALFGAACAAGAIVAAQPPKVHEEARRLGIELGVLFQLHDDAIDHLPEKGRKEGSDTRNHKATALQTVGQTALAAARDRTTEALARIELAIIEGETAVHLGRTRQLLTGLIGESE
jgi:geranylgeranyl diphosphate synthase type II